MTSSGPDLPTLIEGLRGRASSEGELTVGVCFGERLDSVVEPADAGEVGIAVENLVSNLDEYDVELTVGEHAVLLGLAKRWGVARGTAEERRRLKPDL